MNWIRVNENSRCDAWDGKDGIEARNYVCRGRCGCDKHTGNDCRTWREECTADDRVTADVIMFLSMTLVDGFRLMDDGSRMDRLDCG